MFKQCTGCGFEKSFDAFGKHKKGKFGLNEKCKICVSIRSKNSVRSKESIEKNKKYKATWQKKNRNVLNERLRDRYRKNFEESRLYAKFRQQKYRQTKKGKMSKRKYDEEYNSKYKERIKARHKFKYAICKKKLIRPNICDICKKTCKPYGHHEDYSKPLEVIWMCPKCHFYYHNSHRIYRDRLSEKTP